MDAAPSSGALPNEHDAAADQHQPQQQDGEHAAAAAAPPPQQQQNVECAAPPPQQQQQPAWQRYSSVFTNAKPGMAGVDQEKVKQTVYEMSKDSAHFANEQRKQAQTDARIARLKAQAAQLSPAQLAAYQRSVDAKIAHLEAGRELTKTWLHVDMDAFYCACEERDNPALAQGVPMAVGGIGMICTANYVARTYGVRSAMPGFIAKKLCPQLIFVKPDFSKYTAASAEAFAVFRSYDARVQGASLDEAYLDVTQHCSTHGMTGEQVAAELRAKVCEATRGLTCSVGIAPNMMLAKIASDRNKPNGQFAVGATRDQVLAFIADLPIRKIPGIGKVTEQVLQALGVSTCSDLIRHAALLTALLSDISSSSLLEAGLGLGATQHSSSRGGDREQQQQQPGRKGISCERTFGAMSAAGEMEAVAESLVTHLAADMASESIEAKTLTLKLKTTAFEVRTRAVTLPTYACTPAAMLPPLLRLLRAELPLEIRLMGVRASNLRKAAESLDKLAAAAAAAEGGTGSGRKLNALERLVLQGMHQQQQQGKDEQHEQQQQEVDSGSEQGHVGDGEGYAEEEYEEEEEEDVGLLPTQPLLLTQEQLQAHYEQQEQQHQQQQQHGGPHEDATHHNTAAAAAWGSGLGLCGGTHADQLDSSSMASGLQQQQQPPSVAQQPQQQQQQQPAWGHQQDARLAISSGGGGDTATMQASKKQRRSFQSPALGGLTAAATPHAPQHLQAAAVQQLQQQGQEKEQQAGFAQAAAAQQQHCYSWQRASDYQQQQQQPEGHQQQQQPSTGRRGQHTNSSSSSGAAATWTCLVCTFADNEHKWLRCSVCDTPKGDTQWAPAAAAAAGVAAGAGSSKGGRGGDQARRGRGRGLSRSGSGSKQLTLEQLRLHKPSRGGW